MLGLYTYTPIAQLDNLHAESQTQSRSFTSLPPSNFRLDIGREEAITRHIARAKSHTRVLYFDTHHGGTPCRPCIVDRWRMGL